MNFSWPSKCRDPLFCPLRRVVLAMVLGMVGFLAGCSSWSASASPGKFHGWLIGKGRDASLQAKVEADQFPSAGEVGLQTSGD
jgi:hypothetical protein